MSKTQKLLKHLQSGRPITGVQALNKFGLYRLSDAIHKLRKRGHTILTEDVGKEKYARYHYVSSDQRAA